MTAAGVWLRVSAGHQDSDKQVPDVRRFAAHHGYQVTETYQLSESAWNGGEDNGEYQAALQRAMDDAWQGKFSVLIVWALDRMTRDGAAGALEILRQFRERGCMVLSVQDSWLNGSPDVQDILVAFASWAAKQESDRKSARIRAGLARRKAEGKPVGGRKPGAKDKSKRRTDGYVAAWEQRRQGWRQMSGS